MGYVFLWGNFQPHWTIERNIYPMLHWRHYPCNQTINTIHVSKNNRVSTFVSNQDILNATELGKNFLDEEKTKQFLLQVEQRANDHWKVFEELRNADFSQKSNEELGAIYSKVMDEWSLTVTFFRPTQAEGVYFLTEKIKENFSEEETSLLLTPCDLDIINQEQLAFNELIKKEITDQDLFEHAFKYPLMVAANFSHEDVLKFLRARYDFCKNNPQLEILEEKSDLRARQLKILSKKPEMASYVKMAQDLAKSRTKIKSCFAGTDFYLIPFFQELAQRSGEKIYDLNRYYLTSDIFNLLNGKKLSEEEKKNRQQCFIGLLKDGKEIYASGNEAEKIASQELGELYQTPNVKEFTGRTANSGKYTGIARVLYANDTVLANEFRKTFQKGQILVTQMTQPNIIDIASKAGAIITDEGGMLSHAAIISREFKIPCIVGTHIGSKVIKDGDLVELDAEIGIVKKIELDPKDFIPLFHGEFTTSYFVNEFWTGTSMARSRILVIQKEKSWSSFIDYKGREMCLTEGLHLFQNHELFENYIHEFEEAIKYSNKVLIPKYLTVPENVTKEELKKLFEFMKRYWYLYGFTENPHHDLAYNKMLEEKSSIIQNNLNRTYAAKVEGRKIMNAFFFTGGVIPNVIEFFSKEYFNDSESAMYLSLTELLALIDGKYLEQSQIEQRKNCTVLLSLQKRCIELPAQRGIELANKLMEIPQTDSVKGTIANKGKTTGRAVIAPMLDNLEAVNKVAAKMHDGAVLIAQTTSPELMILCEKAAAIVADQGGMMSHAAIISRELNIPCIVGTNIATKVFNDGDLVEVDANNGFVKKIDKGCPSTSR